MSDIVNKTKDIINKNNLNNVHFLNDNYYDVGNYKFIGGLLWSKITDPEFAINDKYTIGNYSTENMNFWHDYSRIQINTYIAVAKAEKKIPIVISHHLPSYDLIHSKYTEYAYAPYNQCFASHSDDLIKPPIACWIFGHTHCVTDKVVNGVRCVANPIGYKGENDESEIVYNRFIDIK